MRDVKIYYLYDINEGVPRYIGKTTGTLKKRLRDHISAARRNPITYKDKWCNKVIDSKSKIDIKLIEICNESNWQRREKYWINKFKNLTNATEGGECFGIPVINVPVFQYDLNGRFIKEYKSIQEAININNLEKGTIDSALDRNPERDYCKGFLWRKSICGFKKYLKPYINHKIKPCIIIDLLTDERKIFESIKEGLDYFNLPYNAKNSAYTDSPYKRRYQIIIL